MEKLYLYSKKIEGKPYKTNFIELIKTLTNSNTSENFSSSNIIILFIFSRIIFSFL